MWKQGLTFDEYIKWLNNKGQTLENTRFLFGLIPAYPVFMFLAVVVVILLCVIQLKRKKIPLKDFEIGIFIVVPCAVIGASFFGKIFLPNYQQWSNVFKVFFFWQPGMSFFGCFFLGVVSGFAFFYKRSRVTRISIWVYFDIFIVNVLIGQAIGRWGNLYNHEILGWNVSYDQISWLPNFIKQKLFYFPEIGSYQDLNGNYLSNNWISEYIKGNISLSNYFLEGNANKITLAEVVAKPLQFKAPLFLIESVLNILLWILITFGFKNIHKIINWKNNPWILKPKAYPTYWNKINKSMFENELESWPTLAPIVYKKTKDGKIKMNLENVWRKAHFWKTPNYEKINIILKENDKYWNQINLDKKNMSKEKFKNKYNFQLRILRVNPFSKNLDKINNPNNYKLLRSGVSTGIYIFGYSLIRIILETTRKPTEYMIANFPVADFIVLSLILITGILIIVLTQFVIPYKWREIGWLYEKSY